MFFFAISSSFLGYFACFSLLSAVYSLFYLFSCCWSLSLRFHLLLSLSLFSFRCSLILHLPGCVVPCSLCFILLCPMFCCIFVLALLDFWLLISSIHSVVVVVVVFFSSFFFPVYLFVPFLCICFDISFVPPHFALCCFSFLHLLSTGICLCG